MKQKYIQRWEKVISREILFLSISAFLMLPPIVDARQSEADRIREEKAKERRIEIEKKAKQEKINAENEILLNKVKQVQSLPSLPTGLSRLREDVPVNIRNSFQIAETQREGDINACLYQLNYSIKTRRPNEQNGDEFQTRFERLLKRLEELHTNNPLYMPWIFLDGMEIGMVGRFRYPGNVVGVDYEKPTMKIIQIIDANNFIGSTFGKWIWFQKMSLGSIVDGDQITLKSFFQIIGTKTYTTAIGGSKTVLVAEPINVDQYLN